jgi:hypothetical protein
MAQLTLLNVVISQPVRQPARARPWELVTREVCSGCGQPLAEDAAPVWLTTIRGVFSASDEVKRAHDTGKCLACFTNPE